MDLFFREQIRKVLKSYLNEKDLKYVIDYIEELVKNKVIESRNSDNEKLESEIQRAFAGGFIMGAGKQEDNIINKIINIKTDYENYKQLINKL